VLNVRNIFADVATVAGQEQFLSLFESGAVTVKRIVSHSYQSPTNFWYDQPESEWVIILRGEAVLEFESGKLIELKEGDHVSIHSHVKHRVHRTGPETVWLAVHVK
jgi:cupin 2 domain-containing protein